MKGFGARESGYWSENFVLLSFFTTMLQGILRHFDALSRAAHNGSTYNRVIPRNL